MINWHEFSDWAASAVLTTIGYFTRLVFGHDRLTTKQLICFYLFCGGVLWITNTFMESGMLRSGILLCAGLVIPNIITGIISGAEKSEKKVTETVEKAVDKISGKIEDIADAINKKDEAGNNK